MEFYWALVIGLWDLSTLYILSRNMPTKDKKQKKRLVLRDAHGVLDRAYHALPKFTYRAGEPTGVLYGLSAMLIKLLADLAPDYVIACFDMAGPTFRHEAYEQYKAQRP